MAEALFRLHVPVDCQDPDCYGVAFWTEHRVVECRGDQWYESDVISCATCHRSWRILDSTTPPDLIEWEDDEDE